MLRTGLLLSAIASIAVSAFLHFQSRTGDCAAGCDTTHAVGKLDEDQKLQMELAELVPTISSGHGNDTDDETGIREPGGKVQWLPVGNFEDLLGPADTRTGRQLMKAFDAHDRCAGIPRDTTNYTSWLERHAGEVDFSFELAEHLYEECRGVPVLFFDQRVKLIEPIAQRGDAIAQYLLGTSYPLGTHTRSIWLLRAAENGHAPAHISLVEQLRQTSGDGSGVDRDAIEWYLYRRAGEISQGLGAIEFEQIESKLNESRREFVEAKLSNGSIELMLQAALDIQ